MAKLTRVTGKVFGATANSTGTNPEIGQFGSAKAGTYTGTGDVATIQGLSAWSNGWIDAVTPTQQFPTLPEMTGVHKVLSYQNAYLLQQGIPEWDSSTDYYTNGFCSKNGKIYYSLTDNNTNHDPESDTVNWAEFTSGAMRNIGEIVQSTIPLTDAGLHLLDGSLLAYGSYKDFVDYIADLYDDDPTASCFAQTTTEYDYNEYGSITNTDGVLTGFSTDNHIIVRNIAFAPSNNSWETVIKFATGSTISTKQCILSGTPSNYASFEFYITDNNHFHLGISSTGTSENVVSQDGTFTISANTTYYVKCEFTGTAYTLKYSTDGTNYTTDISVSSSTAVLQTDTVILGVGFTTYPSPQYVYPLLGSIDLNGSYIKINNEYWWRGGATYTPEQWWQYQVTRYGVCGKFVYDSVNNTVRLPKITGFTESTIDATTVGDLVEAGLPNITGEFSSGSSGIVYSSSEFSGAFIQGTSLAGQLLGQGTGGSNKVGFNASASNSIYGNSNTVQPQSIKVLYYIVVATSTKTDIQVDIDEIATDLNGKADVDLSNAVPSSSFASVLLTSGIGTVISSFHSGDDFYIVFAGGFCIQGGRYGEGTGNTSGSVTYLKVFAQNDYCLQGNLLQALNAAAYDNEKPNTPTTTGFSFSYYNGRTYSWFAMGQLAEGEY